MAELAWKTHPLKENPGQSIVLILFILAIMITIGWSYRDPFSVILAAGIFFISLKSYFFPTEYQFTNLGIESRSFTGTRLRKWTEFRSFYRCRKGIQLSTFESPNWLDSFRGMYLITGNQPMEPILDGLRNRMKECP